ncbi:hypothetical protein, partial [Streptomyces chartreusis]|uniref:hypothetical protein n=1 Tax=Streptomyces chartreusis TaxID=1969 RepID=UPI003630BF80
MNEQDAPCSHVITRTPPDVSPQWKELPMVDPPRGDRTAADENAQWPIPSILELQKLALEKKIHALKDEGNFELL